MTTYELNEFGLREKDMKYLLTLLAQYPELERAGIFGSRATGSHDRGSDVDLVLYGEGLSQNDASSVHFKLENESPTLLFFDVLLFHKIKNRELREKIMKEEKIIYTRHP